jgi:hypothetical protein
MHARLPHDILSFSDFQSGRLERLEKPLLLLQASLVEGPEA